MSTSTVNAITYSAEEAAAKFVLATSAATKWEFLDYVADGVEEGKSRGLSQKEVIERIGDTAGFRALHGDHRDSVAAKASKAKSRIKSIRDEVSVVKVWPATDRVDGVSFEAHKVLNRLGSTAGKQILTSLAKEMGGPGNVTKAAVAAKLKMADPDHVPQKNGKVKPVTGNHVVTAGHTCPTLTTLEMAEHLAFTVTVGDLSKDTALAAAVEKLADIFEAFSKRNAAKAKATAPTTTTTSKVASSNRAKKAGKAPAVKAPAVKAPAVKAPAVKAPAVKAPAFNVKAPVKA